VAGRSPVTQIKRARAICEPVGNKELQQTTCPPSHSLPGFIALFDEWPAQRRRCPRRRRWAGHSSKSAIKPGKLCDGGHVVCCNSLLPTGSQMARARLIWVTGERPATGSGREFHVQERCRFSAWPYGLTPGAAARP